MTTTIVRPYARTPTSGRGSGIVSGAAQGASSMASTGNAYAIIGGAIVGGIAGYIGGAAQDKAARHATLAYKWAKIIKEREVAIERRNMLRSFRMARATNAMMIGSETGADRSSAPLGALSGLNAQWGFNVNYFDAQYWAQTQMQKHMNKAKKQSEAAKTYMAMLSTGTSAMGSFAGGFNFPSTTSTTGSTSTMSSSVYNTSRPTQSSPEFNSQFSPWGNG